MLKDFLVIFFSTFLPFIIIHLIVISIILKKIFYLSTSRSFATSLYLNLTSTLFLMLFVYLLILNTFHPLENIYATIAFVLKSLVLTFVLKPMIESLAFIFVYKKISLKKIFYWLVIANGITVLSGIILSFLVSFVLFKLKTK